MKKIIVVVLLLILPSFTAAAKNKPLTVEKLVQFDTVGSLDVSPNSEWLVYVVSKTDLDENKTNNDIYMTRMDGTRTVRLTSNKKSDYSPKWSPDGRRIAFISRRSDTAQIWLIDTAGGEPEQLTEFATNIHRIRWSPDGKSIYFTSSVVNGCDDSACNEKRQKEKEESKLKARVITEPLYRHWQSWLEDKHGRLFRINLKDKKINPVTPQGLFVPPIALRGFRNFDIAPDSKQVVFTTNTDKDLSYSTNNDIFFTDKNGKGMRLLTQNKAWDSDATFSPDGRYIAYRAQAVAGYESDRRRLMLYNTKTKKHRELTKSLDNWVGSFVWSPDSQQLYFTAEDRGYRTIYSLKLETGTITPLTSKTTNYSLRAAADGRWLVFVRSSFNQPPEIFKLDVLSGRSVQLTKVNDARRDSVQLSKHEEFEYTSIDGQKVHGFLVFPPNFKPRRKYPLILVIHGGPQGAWQNVWHSRWNANMFAAPGYVAALINPRGSIGYGQKFIAEVSRDYGGKCYQDLMAGVDHLIATKPYIDKRYLAAMGGSFGGYMVTWIAGQTDRFNALISHAGVSDMEAKFATTEEKWFPNWDVGGNPYDNPENYQRFNPIRFAKNFKSPMLILHGHQDFRVSLEQALILYGAYQTKKAPVKMVLFPNEGHWISRPKNVQLWWNSVHDWLATHIRKPLAANRT